MDLTKVSFVSISDGLGGAEQVMLKAANYLLDNNIKVKFYFLNKQTNSYWKIESKYGKSELYYSNGSIFNLIKSLNNDRHELIFSSHLMINAILGLSRKLKLLKSNYLIVRESTSVFLRYSGFKLLMYKLAYYVGYRKIDLLICQTNEMVDVLIDNLPYMQKRVKILKVSNPFVKPTEKQNLKIDAQYIVSAGRLIYEKGFEILIEAFSLLKIDNPNLKLIILGDGVLKKSLLKLIEQKALTNDVTLQGHVVDVYPYFEQASLCVVSSIKEGFPNVLLQMMSQNSRVVSTICAGDIDIIKGLFLAKPNDVNSLFNAMNSALLSDRNNRERFDEELNRRSIKAFVETIVIEAQP